MVLRTTFFNRACTLGAISVFLLFILGGLVRSTGSGMGCPDWPKCFGKLVPPNSASELPSDYQNQFLEKRLKKVARFTTLLESLGRTSLAEKVKNDPQLKIAHPYNKRTAYTEWINRLFGILTGVFSLMALYAGLKLRKSNKSGLRWVLFAVFWVVFNGWLGSVVVDTNLVPGIVTIHYAAAYLAMLGFIFAINIESKKRIESKFRVWIIISLLFLVFDIFLGTTTREIIDNLKIAHNFELKQSTVWIPGTVFIIHRFLGFFIFILSLVIYFNFKKNKVESIFLKIQGLIVILFTMQVSSGILNVFYDIPALINVVHIAANAAVVGLQLWMIKLSK